MKFHFATCILLCAGFGAGEIHEEESHKVLSRQKRFIFFNTQTPVDIGLLITVPLTFALPTFSLKTSRRFRRESEVDQELTFNMTADDILPRGSYDDAAYSHELQRMSTYFSVLEIEEDICQQKILCEIFTDAEKFKPMSDMFMKKLTVDRGIVPEKTTNRYFRYVQAMQNGLLTGDRHQCQKLYNRCPYSTEDRIHLQALQFWAFLTSMLRLEFRDE
ncbi:unnamed protein product [Allacma fusca]|uniref:Uncharacterized protein n=1 Tax=Allacma fusca TaxID=39272 RepID=A0A8J2PW27_9HEXA|nr:unnamed protein product [Allacma fusca]